MARRRGCKSNIFLQNNPSVSFADSSLYTREPYFLSPESLSVFLDKHCICVHKCKIRHTSFEIYRIFENCPLERHPKISSFFARFLYFLITSAVSTHTVIRLFSGSFQFAPADAKSVKSAHSPFEKVILLASRTAK